MIIRRTITRLSCLTCLFVAGCGVAAKMQARNEMMQSEATYKACLAEHPDNISACAGARAAYETDLQMFRATSAGIKPGRSDNLDITVGR
jgi:hypothetical protein